MIRKKTQNKEQSKVKLSNSALILDAIMIRQSYMQKVKEKLSASSILVKEFPICAGKAKADIALIENSKLTGIEIKSDRDSLQTLRRQTVYYDYTFDELVVICTKKYLNGVEERVPSFWKIIVAESIEGNEIQFKTHREGSQNPYRLTKHIATLLEEQDLISLLSAYYPEEDLKLLSKQELYLKTAQYFAPDEMRDFAIEAIKNDPRNEFFETKPYSG